MCVCVCERERELVCVYVWERRACMAQWLIKVMGSLAILNLTEPDPYAGAEGRSGDLLYAELFCWNAIMGHFT